MKIVWRARARADIVALVSYLERESPKSAARVRDEILDAVGVLSMWPAMAKEIRDGVRELVVTRTPYVVIYRLTRERVTVLRVIHTSRKR